MQSIIHSKFQLWKQGPNQCNLVCIVCNYSLLFTDLFFCALCVYNHHKISTLNGLAGISLYIKKRVSGGTKKTAKFFQISFLHMGEARRACKLLDFELSRHFNITILVCNGGGTDNLNTNWDPKSQNLIVLRLVF